MVKEKTITIFLIIFFILVFFSLFLYKPYEGQYSIEKVRVDSISYRDKYTFLPDKMWLYYTKHGVISSTIKKYNVGDSLEIKFLKIKK